MSWEVVGVNEYDCPCGKGTYTVKTLMDDWNRTETKWEMNCPKCKENYRLYEYTYFDHGMNCKGRMWARNELYSCMKELENKIRKLKSRSVEIIKENHMDQWLDCFRDAKTKKEVWCRLTNNGEKSPSLSTFYKNTGSDIYDYLRAYIKYINLSSIIEITKIDDEDLDIVLKQIDESEKELEDIILQIRKEWIRMK